jgi:(S)-2-hydroxyglutarate dehydrogenase
MPGNVEEVDVLVIGAGAVGLATAWQLQRSGVGRVLVVEKEAGVARHQTGRNSGVLHSGIYYQPGSLRARTCRRGRLLMEAFCAQTGVAYERCGKVVVATDASELPALKRIAENALGNGVHVERIGPERLRELEPSAQGIEALWVPDTGIVDFVGACQALVRQIAAEGGAVRCRTEVSTARAGRAALLVETNQGPIAARLVVSCAGLHADRVAKLLGVAPQIQVVPFRGEYHLLCARGRALVKNLIYPVPDPRFPFLGVHFTRRFDGTTDCGPNAVLARGREAYDGCDIELDDLLETLSYPGFLKLAIRNFGYGVAELHRSLSKRAFAQALQRLVPSVSQEDLQPGPSGIRAQAVTRDGVLFGDFLIEQRPRVVCVLNAPSPAATASLEIGRIVAEMARAQLD